MPHDQLDNLVKVGKLKAESPSDQEVAGLISSGLARLHDAGNETLSVESRFDLAYNAAHALSLAALRRAGYRSENRYLVFQCLKPGPLIENSEVADEALLWSCSDPVHDSAHADGQGQLTRPAFPG